MKLGYPFLSITELCSFFEISRQAYYQHNTSCYKALAYEEIILEEVKLIRDKHTSIGGKKLHLMLEPVKSAHNIKLGRDTLFSLLSRSNLLIRKRRRREKTTNSKHWLRRYPNLIRGFTPTGINQLWVSDITYWKTEENTFLYISFITDAYSRKIVGYSLSQSLEASGSVRALKMALSTLGEVDSYSHLIHHSDRGVQYCSSVYTKILKEKGIRISMTENGDPLENAIAERVNGIIKEEYLNCHKNIDLEMAQSKLSRSIALYNNERPHMSIENCTPNNVHYSKDHEKRRRLWRNYYQNRNRIVNPV